MYFIHEIWPGNTNSVLLGELHKYSLAKTKKVYLNKAVKQYLANMNFEKKNHFSCILNTEEDDAACRFLISTSEFSVQIF